MKLFLTAFIQVALVSMNVVFISKGYIIPMILTGFGISFTWTFNVKKIAFGSNTDRIIYAFGAATGTAVGYFLANNLSLII